MSGGNKLAARAAGGKYLRRCRSVFAYLPFRCYKLLIFFTAENTENAELLFVIIYKTFDSFCQNNAVEID